MADFDKGSEINKLSLFATLLYRYLIWFKHKLSNIHCVELAAQRILIIGTTQKALCLTKS